MEKNSIWKRMLLSLIVLVLAVTPIFAQSTYCVRAGATGTGTGADWNNAMPALPATLTRGSTYYVADGSYVGRSFSTAVSGTTLITIKKATVTDHGAIVGWTDAFGDGQAIFNGQLSFSSSYWEIDGQTGGGPAAWNTGFGFKIIEVGNGNALILVGNGSTANNVSVRHVEMEGKGSVSTSGGSASNDGLAIYGDSTTTLSYAWMHGIGRCPFFFSGNINTVMEYVYVQSYFGSSGVHCEVMSSGQGFTGDTTFRNNLVADIESTGGLMWDNSSNPSSHLYVYGNVFYKPAGAVWEVANGIIGGWTGGSGEQFNNCYVFNNTFINCDQQTLSTFPNVFSGNNAQNNLWYNCNSPSFSLYAAHDFNHFINSGGTHSEANGTSATSGDPFVNFPALNFQLKTNTSLGTNLGSPYNIDPTGKVRSTWTRGAYEFGGVGDTNPPVIASVTATAVTSVGANIGWNTQEAATSIVEYGVTTAYGSSVNNLSLTLAHTVTLVSLTPSTLYHYRVRSTDASGNASLSGDFTFTTGVADTTAPSIALASPGNSTIVSNTVSFSATASDNVGVIGVRFYVNGNAETDISTSPFSYSWDSVLTTNGNYKISAQARDAAGNVTWSATNTVAVNNPVGALPSSGVAWDFSEGAGSSTLDAISNARLNFRGGATWTAGKFGNGLLLDGISARADATNNSRMDYDGNALTVAVWVKLDNINNWQQIVAKVTDVGVFSPPYFCWHLYAGTVSTTQWTPQFQLANTSQTAVDVSSATAVNYGEWVHLAGVYDGTTVKIYVNGINQGSAPQTGNVLRASQPLYVGAHGLPGEFAKGTVDDVRVFPVALTSAQIQVLLGGVRPTPPSGLHIVSSFPN